MALKELFFEETEAFLVVTLDQTVFWVTTIFHFLEVRNLLFSIDVGDAVAHN